MLGLWTSVKLNWVGQSCSTGEFSRATLVRSAPGTQEVGINLRGQSYSIEAASHAQLDRSAIFLPAPLSEGTPPGTQEVAINLRGQSCSTEAASHAQLVRSAIFLPAPLSEGTPPGTQEVAINLRGQSQIGRAHV